MLTIITGAVDSGKTARMTEMAAAMPDAGGFLCRKVYRDDEHIGYDLHPAAGGTAVPFIRAGAFADPQQTVLWQRGPWRFYEPGFRSAEQWWERDREAGRSPLFLDEIGPLELAGNGFAGLIEKWQRGGGDLIASVRRSCLEDVLQWIGDEDYRIIDV